MEADPRHDELLIQELTREESRAISAPGSAEVSEEKRKVRNSKEKRQAVIEH